MIAKAAIDKELIGLLSTIELFLFSMRPVIMAYVMDVTPPGVGATTVGFMFTANMVLSALSPLVSGFIAEGYGVVNVFYFIGGMNLLGALLALISKLS